MAEYTIVSTLMVAFFIWIILFFWSLLIKLRKNNNNNGPSEGNGPNDGTAHKHPKPSPLSGGGKRVIPLIEKSRKSKNEKSANPN